MKELKDEAVKNGAVTEDSIKEFARLWYRKLDVHAPMVELLPMLLDQDLKLVFPEATEYGWKGFENWYQRVIRTFFDEEHTVLSCEAEIDGGSATVKVVVEWHASLWNPPEYSSRRIMAIAYQTWKVVSMDGQLKISQYIVDKFEYKEGSAEL